MEITIKNSRKAQVLQVLNNAKRKFLLSGKQLKFKILNENPMDDVCNVEILPDEYAKYIVPKLEQFKSTFSSVNTKTTNEPNVEDKLRKAIQEILSETIFKK